MQRSITKNQLLQFIYTYKELKTAIQRLPRLRKNPANKTLQSILTYSRKEKIRDTAL